MYTYDYDFTYNPSMPVVPVEVTPFDRAGETIFLSAMLDSGSDGSMIPLKILQQMKVRKSSQVTFRSITGARSVADVYEVSLRLGSHTFPKVRVVADRHNTLAILGRDVLNHLIVTLNGLAAITEIHD